LHTARLLLPIAIAALLSACVEAPSARTIPSMLDTRGEGARIAAQEWWFLFWTAAAIVLLVTGLLIAVLVRHRRAVDVQTLDPQPNSGIRWVLYGGIAMPVVVLLIVFFFTIGNTWALSTPPSPESSEITVVGHRWWWEVQYPAEGFITANQLVVPVGESVRLNLTSADVIHSFWVPQLHYKRDLISGQMNYTWLQANEPGVYRGVCAEFCGDQHAHMMFTVVALEPDAYAEWLANEGSDARPPDSELEQTGQQIFLSSTCLYCHTIRGTPAVGETGPDLTHLASRQTIAAGTLENNTGNLGGWIMDPQHIKPGAAMPAATLTGEQLQALLAYLTSLE
jgi:cytochrome c oxidase subunit 2